MFFIAAHVFYCCTCLPQMWSSCDLNIWPIVIRPVAIRAVILLYSEIKTVQKLVCLIRPIAILAIAICAVDHFPLEIALTDENIIFMTMSSDGNRGLLKLNTWCGNTFDSSGWETMGWEKDTGK